MLLMLVSYRSVLMMEIFLILLFSGSSLGLDYCSIDKENVKCVPCTKICSKEICNIRYFKCPKQCGISIEESQCQDVCSEKCLHSKCEYVDVEVKLSCSDGCVQGLTGRMCDKFCPQQCKECHQFNTTCTSCKDSSTAPNCTESDKTTIQTSSTASSSTVTATSFPENCDVCNVTKTECTTCIQGRCRSRCYETCQHCNHSRCSLNDVCLECLNVINGVECNHITTSKEGSTEVTPEDNIGANTGAFTINFHLLGGLVAGIVVTIAAFCICKLTGKYQLHCPCKERVHEESTTRADQISDKASAGYTYIDDNDLISNPSGVNSSTPPTGYEQFPNVRGSLAENNDEMLPMVGIKLETCNELKGGSACNNTEKPAGDIPALPVVDNETCTFRYFTPTSVVQGSNSQLETEV